MDRPQISAGPLTAFQIQVARLFFDLDEAVGFLVAGGAALAAVGLTERPTQDLDLFTAPGRGLVSDAAARWNLPLPIADGLFAGFGQPRRSCVSASATIANRSSSTLPSTPHPIGLRP